MKKLIFLLALSGMIGFGVSCTEKSDRLVPVPPDGLEKIDDDFDASGFFAPKVDILFVIDNSGSMSEHQKNLSSNIDLFVSEITGGGSLVDYRIGVTTTDDNDIGGTLIRTPGNILYVDKSTPNGDFILRTRLKVGTNSSTWSEQSFNPVWRALSPQWSLGNTVNAGFLRPDAYLAIVFITDAEDQSTTSHPRMTPESFVLFLDDLKGPGNWFTYGAILPMGPVPCRRDESEPKELQRFLTMTNSPFFSLCAPDFGKNLAALGQNLVSRVGRSMLLDRFPIVETIKVTYGSQVIPPDRKTGWYYVPSQNSLNFGEDMKLSQQPKGTQIKITFVTKRK